MPSIASKTHRDIGVGVNRFLVRMAFEGHHYPQNNSTRLPQRRGFCFVLGEVERCAAAGFSGSLGLSDLFSDLYHAGSWSRGAIGKLKYSFRLKRKRRGERRESSRIPD